jgi:hypothetical protein
MEFIGHDLSIIWTLPDYNDRLAALSMEGRNIVAMREEY